MASVKVAVRVRPFNGREKQLSSQLVVNMTGQLGRVVEAIIYPIICFHYDNLGLILMAEALIITTNVQVPISKLQP